ncbi:IS110 family transposase [Mesorhizobium sp. M1088]|uniref:IS110 family transposase n=1 Tax=Mesorhizobium sp. M1088 TaxID=2957056 RepID=UPI00333C5AC9
MNNPVYIGLDASLDETSICIVDCDGKIVFETKVESNPDALHSALKGYVERAQRIGIKASSIGVWLARELLLRKLPVIVVEARHMRTSLSAMRNKTDKNDARGIAQMMRMAWFRAVHVKGVENQRFRTMLANRKLLKRKLVDLENHIRGSLRVHGLKVGAIGRHEFEARARELLDGADFVFERMIDSLLAVRNAVLEGYDRLHTMLLNAVAADPVCRRFMTVPGVGPVAALTYKVAIDDPHRFSRSRTVGAHFGLTPRRHQSGSSIDFTGRITKQGDMTAREALCEAAAAMLLRSRRGSALKGWGLKIAKKRSMLCAITAVARKLAAILHRMWVDGRVFDPGAGAVVTPTMRATLKALRTA